MTRLADTVHGVIGVDTHRDTLAAAATDWVGGTLGRAAAATGRAGCQRLLAFGQAQVPGRRCWPVEGAGSYGAGLTSFLSAHGERHQPAQGADRRRAPEELRAVVAVKTSASTGGRDTCGQ